MNKIIYKAFNDELIEKQASIFDALGKVVSTGSEWAWSHPKTAVGLVLGAIAAPHILKMIFPAAILHGEHEQGVKMDEQTGILRSMLAQQQMRNIAATPRSQPTQRLIQRPLV